jgi:hypothetical protein
MNGYIPVSPTDSDGSSRPAINGWHPVLSDGLPVVYLSKAICQVDELTRFIEPIISGRIPTSVHRKSEASHVEVEGGNAVRRGFLITRFERRRWRFAADAGGYGESNLASSVVDKLDSMRWILHTHGVTGSSPVGPIHPKTSYARCLLIEVLTFGAGCHWVPHIQRVVDAEIRLR